MFNQPNKNITVPGAEISPLEYGLKAQHRDGLIVMEEIWKPVLGFEGLYEVSSFGNVKTLHRISKSAIPKVLSEKILSGGDCKGYPCVILHNGAYNKKFTKHRLVALTFIPNPLNLPQVNHKNGNKFDNRVENLEWCDGFYNQQHRFSVLKQSGPNKGIFNTPGSKPVYQLDKKSLHIIAIYKSCQDAMRKLGKSNSTRIATAARLFEKGEIAYNYRWSYTFTLPLPEQQIDLKFK